MLFISFYFARLWYFECGILGNILLNSFFFFFTSFMFVALCCVIYCVAISYAMFFWISSAERLSINIDQYNNAKRNLFLSFLFWNIRVFVPFIGNGYQMNRLNFNFHSNVIWMSIEHWTSIPKWNASIHFLPYVKKFASIEECQNKMKNSENNWIIIASSLSSFYRFTSHETKPKPKPKPKRQRQWQRQWQERKKENLLTQSFSEELYSGTRAILLNS